MAGRPAPKPPRGARNARRPDANRHTAADRHPDTDGGSATVTRHCRRRAATTTRTAHRPRRARRRPGRQRALPDRDTDEDGDIATTDGDADTHRDARTGTDANPNARSADGDADFHAVRCMLDLPADNP